MAFAPLSKLFRTWTVSDGVDDDHAGEQSIPTDQIDVRGCSKIGVVYVARKEDDTIAGGTLDLQVLDIGAVADAEPAETLITAGQTDLGVGTGDGLEYNVKSSRTVAIRVVTDNLVDASVVKFYWRPL